MNCMFLRRGYGETKPKVNYVEYLQSNGNAYFDTGLKPNYKTRVVLEISDVSNTDTLIFGAKNADSSVASQQYDVYRPNTSTVRSDYFGTNASASVSDTTTKTTIDKNGATVTMWGKTINNTAVSSGEVPYTMYILSANTAGKPVTYTKAKVYPCQVYLDGVTLTADYRPALDPNGAACYYDEVSKEYCYWNGTVTAGPSISGGSNGGGSTAYTVSIDASAWNISISDITIDGTKYTSAATVQAEAGTVVTINLKANYASATFIKLNGTTVSSGTTTYSFAISSNTTIKGSSGAGYYVDITTE